MRKLIVNELVNIKTVGELKEVLSKYNDNLELEIISESGVKEAVGVMCDNNTLSIKVRTNNVIDLNKFKQVNNEIEDIFEKNIAQKDLCDNVIDISSLFHTFNNDEVLSKIEPEVEILKSLLSYLDLEDENEI